MEKNLLIKRLIAYLLDIMIINVIIVLPFKHILKPYEESTITSLFSMQQDSTLALSIFIIMALSLLYFAVMEYKIKQTIGKMIVGLYVISKKPSFNRILLRNITKPFIFLLVIDTIYLLIKRSNQRFTEVLSHTEVREI